MEDCLIPTVWCGNNKIKKNNDYSQGVRYIRLGTRYECLKKGIGTGININENKNGIPNGSIRNIKYIGEIYEKKLSVRGVDTLDDLREQSRIMSVKNFEKFLKTTLVKKNKKIDYRAYNSVILWLHKQGISKLPKCKKIKL